MNLEQYIYACWHRGNGIRQTIIQVAKTFGATLTFDEVRQRFLELANGERGAV